MSVMHEQGLARAQTADEHRLLVEIDAAYAANAWSTLAIYARALDDAIYARRRRESVMVPLIGQTRDEQPRTDQTARRSLLHRTCGTYHGPGVECPPTPAAPGPDGDTRDWPTESIPAVSHAPNVCVCGEPIVYRQTPDRSAAWWGHMDTDVPLDHTCVPR